MLLYNIKLYLLFMEIALGVKECLCVSVPDLADGQRFLVLKLY